MGKSDSKPETLTIKIEVPSYSRPTNISIEIPIAAIRSLLVEQGWTPPVDLAENRLTFNHEAVELEGVVE